VKVKPFFLAGFCIALLVSVIAGVQIAYYFGYERAVTSTATLPVPVSDQKGNFWFYPPYPQVLLGNISWNTSTISQNQTIEVNESITNPLYENTTVVVPYAKCMSEMMLSMSNGTQFFGPGFETTICASPFFSILTKPGQSSNVTFIVGLKDNIPPLSPNAPWVEAGNFSNFVYWWPVPAGLPSGQYELAVVVFQPDSNEVSFVIPISIIT
jgi:hypothetical protein